MHVLCDIWLSNEMFQQQVGGRRVTCVRIGSLQVFSSTGSFVITIHTKIYGWGTAHSRSRQRWLWNTGDWFGGWGARCDAWVDSRVISLATASNPDVLKMM